MPLKFSSLAEFRNALEGASRLACEGEAHFAVARDGEILIWTDSARAVWPQLAQAEGQKVSALFPQTAFHYAFEAALAGEAGAICSNGAGKEICFHSVEVAREQAIYALVRPPASNADNAFPQLQGLEKALFDSREKYRLLVDAMEDFVYACDDRGRITSANRTLAEACGSQPSLLVGTEVSALPFPDGGGARLAALTHRSLETGKNLREEMSIISDAAGGPRIHEVLVQPLRDAQGRLRGTACMARDITVRKRWETALTESEASIRLLSDLAFEGIFMEDENGVIIKVNKTITSMLGRTEGTALTGQNALELFSEQARDAETQRMRGQVYGLYVTEMKRADGSVFPAELKAQAGFFNGKPVRVVSVRNITDRVYAEQMREDVERIIHHDLKSPLTNIIGIPEAMLNMPSTPPEQRRWWEAVSKSGYRMLAMIENSLNLYKMEVGTLQPARTPVPLTEVVDSISADLHFLFQQKKLAFNCLTPEGAPPVINSDRVLLYQMLSNIVKNAAEASPLGGAVTVSIKREADRLRLEVHNAGAIPENVRARIFLKHAQTTKASGSGLGAYSAQLIARTLGTALSFTTSEEEGTTFSILFPADPQEHE